jgi:hypothetical protein
MLRYRGWLETRLRLLIWAVIAVFILWSVYSLGAKGPLSPMIVAANLGFVVAMLAGTLGGAGIVTQRSSLRPATGFHGSTIFTLSLPVTRLRLLAVRVSVSWIELCAGTVVLCAAAWILFPVLRSSVTPKEMLQYTLAMAVCATGLHSLTVVLSTFLDDVWRIYGSILVYAAIWWLPDRIPWPRFADIFGAMGKGSPLIAHSMPWNAMAFSLTLAGGLFFVALQIGRRREY